MSPLVFAVVLLAAVLHASWNALVKSGGDPYLRLAIVNLTHTVAVLPLLPFVPLPDAAAWPWLLGSVFTHLAYYLFLAAGYRVGDLSQIYPIARGVAPPLVALGALLVAGEVLSPTGSFAIALVCLGIWWVAGGGPTNRRPLLLALGTGGTIAAYTVCDGMGGRASGDVLAYIVWLFFLDGWPFALLVGLRRGRHLARTLPQAWKPAVGGGLMSICAYGLVIWAMSIAPMAYVSALRETSVLLAAGIGAFLLGEPFGRRRMLAAGVVVIGVVLLQISRQG
ncbi:MAG: EamA family transporter [Geminicoccaceae bacterium]|nr:EamA family transporter [Geminicoccaceae bacterium]HRY23583.1 DMT family transporter [Geminicoccaceae bacterium]